MLDGVYRSHADGVPEFIEAAAPTEEALRALLQTVIARLMKLLTRRGVLVEDDASCTSPSRIPMARRRAAAPAAGGDGDVLHRLRPARRTQGADPERGDAARGRSAPAPVRRHRRVSAFT